jgi:Xaa-Pro aminopeptidase
MTDPRIVRGDQSEAAGVSRLARVREALARAELSAVVCALPANVLLLSGYWPVVGTACAIVWREGPALVLPPADEREAASQGWADEIRVWAEGTGAAAGSRTLGDQLVAAARQWGGGRIGVERGPAFEAASYAAMCVYGTALWDAVRTAWPTADLVAADDMLAGLRAVKTRADIDRIDAACRVAERGFIAGARALRPGLRETAVAARVRGPFSIAATKAVDRADGFAFCMSGINSAQAYRAYARSTAKRVALGELVLIHANSYVDGYWTDVTRTYCLGTPDHRQRAMYDAVYEARRVALDLIRPGVSGQAVDNAARDVLTARGFGPAFKHSTGHGVGFGAIDHNARPRLASGSNDILEPGMVCNVEPAIYLDGYGGLRHCDMVAVTDTGARLLTPFQASIKELTLT